jgi:tetratricopeptide (TPR) repeat protein
VIAICVARPASADSAPDLLKRGIELYKEGKYGEAIGVLKKSYELDATPDALFALAQAERQSGDCKSAAVHYHQVLERMSDFNVAKFVQQNLALCEKDEPPKPVSPQPAASDAKPAPAPAPIVREVRHVDKLGAVLLAGGALGLGAAGGLYVAASANRAGADRARTFDDHETLSDRAAVQEKAMFVAGGVGVALIGVAVVRWMRGGSKSSTDVAVVPTSTGGAVWVTSRW